MGTPEEKTLSSPTSSPPKTNSRMGCFAITLGIALVIVVTAIAVNRWLAPEVVASETRPVVVSSSNSGDPAIGAVSAIAPANGTITSIISQERIDAADHPFDPLLKVADLCLAKIDRDIRDYTATLVSQVRVDGKLMEEKYLMCKIRHARAAGDREIPFSVYTLFLKPQSNVGKEAIWVDGWHEGNLVAHTTGLLNFKRYYLPPDGSIAMRGNRYPIREIGFRNLLAKMVKIGAKDRKHGECIVTVERNVKINDRICTMLKVVHPNQRDHFEYHIAKIYIDDERNIPIAYEGYLWPENEGDDPPLLEKYFYTNVQLNVGLTDEDFDAGNEEYHYPSYPSW